jgi:hypothetical protein
MRMVLVTRAKHAHVEPSPTILLDHTTRSYVAEQVLQADAVYAVFYQGQPIALRVRNLMLDEPPRYKRSYFPHPGYAFRLAAR